ncbi:MAG: efflux RND transporter permease subunit, partial [Acidimicrobiia bacterium]|nr:efflux RND transporter permease subunit [Acidimicrobiia bacterium]
MSLRARITLLMLSLVAILVGVVQLRSSTTDVFPEFDPPLVEVQTEALGLSASEVESLITVPLEADLLNGVAWLQDIRSESVSGLSSILMEFEPGTDPIRARQMVQERLTQAHALPNVSKPPVMLQPLSSNSRVLMVGLSSDDLTPVELGVLARWNIKPRLLGVPGVANVAVWGHRDRQLQVLVDPADLSDAGVTLDEVIETTGEALWVSPLTFLESSKPGTGGWIDTPNQRLGIRHLLPIATPDDLGKVPVVNHPEMTIADIATVTESHQQLIGDALIDGEPGMIMVIERFPNTDPVAVTEDVEATLSTMRAGLPGVDINTDIFRPAGYVDSMAGNLTTALGIGLVLALIALAFFVWNWRTAVVSLVVILTSLSVAIIVLNWRGASLNIMTIGGLLIALAIIVDDVVVDTHNVSRRLREARRTEEAGSSRTAVFFSALETRRATAPALVILLLVILPVFFLGGLTGGFFSPLATSYAIAIVASFVVALLLTPGLTLLLIGDTAKAPGTSPAAGVFSSIHDQVSAAAGKVGSTVVLAIGAVLAVVGLGTLVLLNTSLTPTFQQDSARVRWEAAPGTSPAVMLDTLGTVSDDLTALDGVEGVGAHVGRAETGDLAVNINTADLWVRFADGADRGATVDAIEAAVADLPGSVEVTQTFIPERLDRALVGPESDLMVRVYGVDLDELDAKAAEIAEVVDVVNGVSATSVDQRVLEPQLEVTVDLAQAEQLGILPGDVRRQATTLISGLQVGSLFEEQKVFDVVVWAE